MAEHALAEASVRLEILQKLFPNMAVAAIKAGKWGVRARVELSGGQSVKYGYLDHSHGLLSLKFYPGDTLGQARAFFRDAARIDGALKLAVGDWDVIPNFHFGFINRGFVWTESRVGLTSYLQYWRDRIDDLHEWSRSEWSLELDRLVKDGVFSQTDLPAFHNAFTDTGRQSAAPRPGIRVSYIWAGTPTPDDLEANLPGLIRVALSHLGEPIPQFP